MCIIKTFTKPSFILFWEIMKTHYSDFRVSFNLKVFWSLRQTQARGVMLHMMLRRLKSLKHIDHPHLNLNRLASLLLSNSYYKATILKWTSSQVFVEGFDYITVIAYDVLELGEYHFRDHFSMAVSVITELTQIHYWNTAKLQNIAWRNRLM